MSSFYPAGRAGAILFRGAILRFFILMPVVTGVSIGLVFVPGFRARGWVFTGGMVLCMLMPLVWYHRAARRLVAAGYRMCLYCRGGLPEGADVGRCGACGRGFDLAEVREEFEGPFSLTGPAGTPRLVRRFRFWAAVGSGTMMAAMLTAILGLAGRHFEAVFMPLMGCGVVLLCGAFFLEWRLLRRIRRGNLMVCPGCEYSLENSKAEGVCPECGRAYEIGEVRRVWARCLKQWRAD